ncbi:MAG: non-canonical purine NTP pyrophosphatase [Verrucomicrobiota bacterium]|nr:non-canonical purine NTP pyrophosphatase [Verrucomicrobiota bacterium]
MISKIIIATGNAHKAEEIRAILGSSYTYETLKNYPAAPKAVEDAPTFAGNSIKKAVALARWLAAVQFSSDTWVLADDSGLEVDCLGGAPGVHSARFANIESGKEGNSSDADNNAKLLRLLAPHPRPWTARFKCVLAWAPILPPGELSASPVCFANDTELAAEIFEGACEGEIIPAARGNQGFGYDPLFVPRGYDRSFAELGDQIKNNLSHRAKALNLLKTRLHS